jgi:hypothetical protein
MTSVLHHSGPLVLLVALCGCDADAGQEDLPPPDACTAACDDPTTETELAACHSCRCKVAFDDWLPPVDELQCGDAEPIVVYRADLSSSDAVLETAGPSATHCANPSLFTGSCRQGSRLGRIREGDVAFYWICRDPYLDLEGSVLYEDVAAIGHNLRTGATCFWDDVDDTTHDDDLPSFDLADVTKPVLEEFVGRVNPVDGSVCVGCHDHDPFLYTPYLQSIEWQSLAADDGPYSLVALEGSLRATGTKHLVSPEAAPCTSCHRIGSAGTCERFALDAFATDKASAYESAVLDAAEPGSSHWQLAYWMPSSDLAIADFAAWLSTFGDAREHILKCCEAPGQDIDGCKWEPVPAQ